MYSEVVTRDVNEIFAFETETRPSQISPRPRPSILASRRDRNWDLSRPTQTETFF